LEREVVHATGTNACGDRKFSYANETGPWKQEHREGRRPISGVRESYERDNTKRKNENMNTYGEDPLPPGLNSVF